MRTAIKGYHTVAMTLHWLIAFAILLQLGGGYAMARMPLPEALKFSFFQWHKTVGLVILALTFARIFWRLTHKPPSPSLMKKWELGLSHLVHFLFYALMLIVPLTGWYMVSVSPTHIPTFLFLSPYLNWPHLPFSGGLEPAENAHKLLAYSFIPLLVLHVAGALKHSLADHAPSFSRMLPSSLERQPAHRGSIGITILLPALLLISGIGVGYLETHTPASAPESARISPSSSQSPADSAINWDIDYSHSALTYEVGFSGAVIKGEIGKWQAFVAFDPDNLDASSARVVVDTASITIGDAFIASSLNGDDGLQTAQFPNAEVLLDRFEKTPDGFMASGRMQIRGVSLPVELPFTFTENADGTAHVTGALPFDRLAFQLGTQSDAKAEWLGQTVTILLSVKARRISE